MVLSEFRGRMDAKFYTTPDQFNKAAEVFPQNFHRLIGEETVQEYLEFPYTSLVIFKTAPVKKEEALSLDLKKQLEELEDERKKLREKLKEVDKKIREIRKALKKASKVSKS